MPRKKVRHEKKNKPEIIRILIISCATEIKYLRQLLDNYTALPDNIQIDIRIEDKNTLPNEKYINKIDNLFTSRNQREYYQIYHIFDLEKPKLNPTVNNSLKYIQSLNIKYPNHVLAITQMPSIEVWFLNHFMAVTHEYENAKEVEKELKKYCKGYNKAQTSPEAWQEIISKTQIALDNYKANKSQYEQLSGNFAYYDITNPMMQIADLILELQNKAVK